jgi:YVTN family beta-propeller protein
MHALRETSRPGGALRLLLPALLLLLPACEAETLYDTLPPDAQPPEIELQEPATGGEAQAGQRIPIRALVTDEDGIAEVVIQLAGAVQQSIVLSYSPPRAQVQVDTAVTIPAGVSGTLEIRIRARDAGGAVAEAPVIILVVAARDQTPPTVTLALAIAPRMERTDSLTVAVRARDNPGGSGVARVGVTLIGVTEHGDTLVLAGERAVEPPSAAEAEHRFHFLPPFPPEALPRELHLEVHAWAVDAEGNCTAAVGSEAAPRVECGTFVHDGTEYTVALRPGARTLTLVVAGRTTAVPAGQLLPDLLVDTLRDRVYVSNLTRNRVQVMDAGSGAFVRQVPVGSQPWGLSLNTGGDTLIVGNSGGTFLSFVHVSTPAPAEDVGRRFYTQNAPLFEVLEEIVEDSLGIRFRYSYRILEFSDRPQFAAQDYHGRILYSTRPTPSAADGVIRIAEHRPDWQAPESRMLVRYKDVVTVDEPWFAIANVDSIDILPKKFDERDVLALELYDHRTGFPDQVIVARVGDHQRPGMTPLQAALTWMAEQGSDILWRYQSVWNLQTVAFADTTFVAASRDRRYIGFGEGGTPAAGRVVLWSADSAAISNEVRMADIVANASERILGLDLNHDGTLGVARSSMGAYFFNRDLRLQGSFTMGPGGAGAVLHNRHPTYPTATAPRLETLGFAGTAQRTIRVVDTVHFTERGEIPIRDELAGVLRVGPRLPGDPPEVLLKLYGITAAGVVVVDVRATDIPGIAP